MSDQTHSKTSMPWWGWLLIGVFVLWVFVSVAGGNNSDSTEEVASESEVNQETTQSESSSNEAETEEYDPCALDGGVFVIRAEDNCIEPWPLVSTSGILYCNPFGEANDSIVYQPDEDPNTYYAVNGSALASGYPEIDPIWLDDPDSGGSSLKINIGGLIDLGLKLCG